MMCGVSVKLNAVMMWTWLSGATAKASSCVRDLKAVAGSLKGEGSNHQTFWQG